ncbi:MAG: hypothetical protein LC754_09310, partial [Acidobacteria bacterium]|nr:hypothetical protein [Acidobacteriota bacterium]
GEVLKYSGDAPAYTFWRQLDGAWHTEYEHWRAKASERIRSLETRKEVFVWDEQKQKFVRE